ncbi:hypothetical protein DNHGIG_32070 [Collibacillus ludicampi]|uniref:Uncharacterized protein n=2 Tax=Collibacillus ludicampi TaxID=2771369 RepID=A0AAV4LIQ9_9BACL|nr:hypothetical protein DNHGIG_32070 [Collibacillus ludicampi]
MLPILYIEDNRIFDTSGQAYAVFKVQSEPYAFQPLHIKHQVIDRVTRGLMSLSGEFWIFLLSKQWSADEILREMGRRSRNPVWQEHQKEVHDYLRYYLPFHRVNLIVVPLNRQRITIDLTMDNWKDWFKQAAAGLMDVKNRFLMGQEIIPKERLEAARKATEEWFAKLAPMVRMEKATLKDIEWWLRKPYFRGLSEPKGVLPDPLPVQVVARGGKTWLRPTRTVHLALSDVRMIERPTHLVIEHPEGEKSYQTFFATVSVPQPIPETHPTGFEWLYGVLENTPFPVDTAIHVRVEAAHEALEHLRKKKKTAEAQYREWVDNDEDVPLELEEDMATVASLEKKLRSRQPLVHAVTVFSVGASNPKELRARTEQFQRMAGSYHTLVRAPGDMKRMFQAFYPFGEELPTSWEIPMDPGVLGAAVPLGTRSLGDPSGFWLGRLLNGRPVWMDPRRPAQDLNTTSAIMLAGTLGSGKSYTLKYLATMLLSWEAKVFLVDPKGETEPLAQLPFDVHILRFTYNSDTRFSPFRVGNVQDARAIMELLFNPLGDDRRQIVINQAVEQVLQGQQWDMWAFYEAVRGIYETSPEAREREEARLVAERVRLMEAHEIGRLFFGPDTGETIFDHDLVTAIVRGLSLPDKTVPKEKWTETERYSAAILYAVATLGLRRLMALPKSVVKVLCIDEAWVLRRFEQGQRLINEAMRFSRSENLIPILATQNATDFLPRADEEDMTGLFAWKIMLHLESQDQVEAALRILGMTDEDLRHWTKRFAEYRNGRGLVRDPEGRIGELQIEVLPRVLDQFFSSTPKSE